MAKRKSRSARIAVIGDSDPKLIPDAFDEVPTDVKDLADNYLSSKRKIATERAKMNTARDDLIVAMKDAKLHKILIDDGEKMLTLTEKDKLDIKRRKMNNNK